MAEKKTYLTTEKAGTRVAGRIVPRDSEGRITVGFPLELTDAEADYELSHGTIVPKADAPAKATRAAKPDA